MLAAAVDIALEEGLGAVSFGRVARRLGTNDRTIVYYFPSKTDLMGAVMVHLGAELQGLLEEAFGDQPLARVHLLQRAWPVLADDQTRPLFAIFFEVIGQAAVGRRPFDELAKTLLAEWVIWLEPRISAGDDRRAEALALLAQVDGLLLLRSIAGLEAADKAARALGVTDG